MKTSLIALTVSGLLLGNLLAQVPQIINYQGRVTVEGVNFEGAGQFKFALVNGGGSGSTATASATISGGRVTAITVTSGGFGYLTRPAVTISGGGGSGALATANVLDGRVSSITVTNQGSNYFVPPLVTVAAPPSPVYTTYWSNDGTSSFGQEPTAAVSLAVSMGLYSVLLGDATLANMSAIPSAVFGNSDVRLRVWFDDGGNGFQLLSPDQRIGAVGYALMAAGVPAGAIGATQIADGAVTSAKLAAGSVGSTHLADGAVTATKLAAGAVGGAHIAAGAIDGTHLGEGVTLQQPGTPDGVRMFLELKAAGEDAPILYGEDTTTNQVGATDVSTMLECVEFDLPYVGGASPFTHPDAFDVWHPARFVLRLGKSTPWIFEAAAAQKNIDLKLNLFSAPDEAGQAEPLSQIRIEQGRIVSARIVQQNHTCLQTTRGALHVEILVHPNVLTVESITGGTLFTHDWAPFAADDVFVFPETPSAAATIPPGEFATYLSLKAAGEDAPILFGEDTTTNQVGATDVSAWLECVEFDMRLLPLEVAEKRLQPARFLLRIGKSTPWIFEAVRAKKRIELTLHFFRRNHVSSEIEQHFQYSIPNFGRIITARPVQVAGSSSVHSQSSFWLEILVHPQQTAIVESMTGGTLSLFGEELVANSQMRYSPLGMPDYGEIPVRIVRLSASRTARGTINWPGDFAQSIGRE